MLYRRSGSMNVSASQTILKSASYYKVVLEPSLALRVFLVVLTICSRNVDVFTILPHYKVVSTKRCHLDLLSLTGFVWYSSDMEDSGYCSRDSGESEICSPSNLAHDIFNMKYSDLSTSDYNYFLYGFTDEKGFEDFKQDLRDLNKLRNQLCDDSVDGLGGLVDLVELQFICTPNRVCKHRRGRSSRRFKEVKQNSSISPKSTDRLLPNSSVLSCSNSAYRTALLEDKTMSRDDLEDKCISQRSARPDSYSRIADIHRKSDQPGFDRNSGLDPSISDLLMAFLNEDEHFQEFERVLDTVRNRRVSKDLGSRHRLSSDRLSRACLQLNFESGGKTLNDAQEATTRFVSDIFADFFDKDETFLEFEKEFSKFKSNRASSLLENLETVNFSDYINNDLKVTNESGSLLRAAPCLVSDEAVPSGDDQLSTRSIARLSVQDWGTMLRKIRQNKCRSLDFGQTSICQHKHSVNDLPGFGKHTEKQKSNSPDNCLCQHKHAINELQSVIKHTQKHKSNSLSDCHCHHRHSINELPCVIKHTEKQNFNSLVDLSCRRLCSRDKIGLSQSETNVIQQYPPLNLHGKRDFETESTCENSTRDNFNCNCCDSDNNSDILENGNVQCSHQCSLPSCFCFSDLHIDEIYDDVFVDDGLSSSSHTRSDLFGDFESQSRANNLNRLMSSLDNLSCYKEYINSSESLPSSPTYKMHLTNMGTHRSDYLSFNDESNIAERILNRPLSCSSSQLSDIDSEYYHTAASDLSGRYSTAESDLSLFIDDSVPDFYDQSFTLDPPEKSSPFGLTSGPSWTKPDEDENCNIKPVWRRQSHSHRQGGGASSCKYRRPLSESACHYTCHQHCLPAVTLSCKSVSGDGLDAVTTRAPGSADPRPHLETSVFMGNFNARPGGARIVPSTSTDTSPSVPQRVTESFQNLQQVPQREETFSAHQDLGCHKHMDTPRPPLLSPYPRSWSVSEDFVTAHSCTLPHPEQASVPTVSTQAQHALSPQCLLPSHSDHPAGSSFQYQETSRHLQTHPVSYSLEPDSRSGLNSKVTRGSNSSNILENIAHHVGDASVGIFQQSAPQDFPNIHRPDEEGNPEVSTEKDETDSGYRSGTIPDDKLPRVPSQTTLDQQELQRKVAKYNHFVPAVNLEVTGKESFQGFLKVTMNLIRPITMELGARPPSIYELLTREHIIEENTQQVAFYMPRDTHKSLHITSDTTTKEVITTLLKKFHILDHPRKFAMYEQEFNDRNKLVRLRRLTDKDFPLRAVVNWDPERVKNYRMVLQENETGEIAWDAFSLPELNNFLRVLDREEKETIIDLKHKYAYMKQYMERRLVELRTDFTKKTKYKT